MADDGDTWEFMSGLLQASKTSRRKQRSPAELVDLARQSWAGAGVQEAGYTSFLEDGKDDKDAPCSSQEASRKSGPNSQGSSSPVSAFQPWSPCPASSVNLARVNSNPRKSQLAQLVGPNLSEC